MNTEAGLQLVPAVEFPRPRFRIASMPQALHCHKLALAVQVEVEESGVAGSILNPWLLHGTLTVQQYTCCCTRTLTVHINVLAAL